MTVAAAVYYTGVGVFHFDGVDYGYGKKLPAGVPAETIKSMREKGKVSDTPPVQGKAAASELGALRDKVRELTVQLGNVTQERDQASDAASKGSVEIGRLQGELSSVRDQLATAAGERDQAKEALSQAQTTIEEMTKAQLSPTPAAPAAPAEAGPAKK